MLTLGNAYVLLGEGGEGGSQVVRQRGRGFGRGQEFGRRLVIIKACIKS